VVLLATIVLQELWAGVRHPREARDLERLYQTARRHGALLDPPPPAWVIAGQALGWRPSVGLEQGLRKTIQYFEESVDRGGQSR